MSLYLDASVLVPMFVMEARTPDAHAGILGQTVIVSDFAAMEFSAGIARRQRMGEIPAADAVALFSTFDAWVGRTAQRAAFETGDLLAAQGLVRRLDLGLRAPDAANIAIAQRLGATLFTFDVKMAAAATAVGMAVQS